MFLLPANSLGDHSRALENGLIFHGHTPRGFFISCLLALVHSFDIILDTPSAKHRDSEMEKTDRTVVCLNHVHFPTPSNHKGGKERLLVPWLWFFCVLLKGRQVDAMGIKQC